MLPLPSSPMSFSDAINKAKANATAETEEAEEGDTPHVQTTMASQPRNMEEGEEDEEEEKLYIPGSFDFGDQGGGAASAKTNVTCRDLPLF